MEEVRFTEKTAHVSLDRYQSLLEAERKLIDIKRCENEIINIPIRQFWDLMRAKEELHYLKSPDIPATFDPGSKVGVTEQEFNSVVEQRLFNTRTSEHASRVNNIVNVLCTKINLHVFPCV